ncbi:MAG: hypothetical protein M3O06_07380 [Pseudomonadota bacterium]|nr:hypothetical protein [Pseudomonadota bacterium]
MGSTAYLSTQRHRCRGRRCTWGAGTALLLAVAGPSTAFADQLPPPLPSAFWPPAAHDPQVRYSDEFRPRGRSLVEPSDGALAALELPTARKNSWQRLSEYRSLGRVQLVTLWKAGGSSLSLQAGRRGGPSLQWTSRFTGGSASRGLLDELISTSISAAASHRRHPGMRAAGAR